MTIRDVLQLARQRGCITRRDVEALVPGAGDHLPRLAKQGYLNRVAPRTYQYVDVPPFRLRSRP